LENRYCEVALGGVSNRNNIIPENELADYMRKARELKLPLYRSYYSFDDSIKQHFEKYKSVRSFKGNLYLTKIIFDIDKGSDTDDFVHERAKQFCIKLNDDWELTKEQIRIYYSGSGYHISIPDIFKFDMSNMPVYVKSTLSHYFPEADNIYDHARLIRVANTINNKTNRYKIPLTWDELFNLKTEEILKLASNPRNIEYEIDNDYPCYKDLIKEPEKPQEQPKTDVTKIVSCMQLLYNKGAVKGSRHQSLLRLASAWRRGGMPEQAIRDSLKRWADNLEPAEVDKIVDDVFSKGYSYSCNDPVMKQYCDSKCVFYKNKDYAVEIASAKDMERKFHAYINNDQSHAELNLNDIYEGINFKFMPGDHIIITGDTGTGKSAFVQNLCVFFNNKKWLYFNFEFADRLWYRRAIQIKYSLTKEQAFQYYRNNSNGLSNELNHIAVYDQPISFDSAKKLIGDVNPQIVVVDTLEGFDVAAKDDIQATKKLAWNLKTLARQLDIIIISVHHISKSAATDAKGNPKSLTVHSLKGSSALEQQSDVLIGIEGSQNSNNRVVKILKGRDENKFIKNFTYDWTTFQYQIK
jgi:archaellum biogenesis ATPase FlaH